MTTKARQGATNLAAQGMPGENQISAQGHPGGPPVQMKGVCKESLETLMRTAQKMNQNHMNAKLDERQAMQQTASSQQLHGNVGPSNSRQNLLAYSAQKRNQAPGQPGVAGPATYSGNSHAEGTGGNSGSHRRLGAISPSAAAAQAVLSKMSQQDPQGHTG